jgi:hypothetical protein
VRLPAARVPAPHLLAASLCAGIALSLAFRSSSFLVGVAALAFAAVGMGEERVRAALLAVALLFAGLWWGSLRLDALDHSELDAEIGGAGPALVEVTGPARRSPFEVRVPVRVLRFGDQTPGERARLDLPAGRAPPRERSSALSWRSRGRDPRKTASTRRATCDGRACT